MFIEDRKCRVPSVTSVKVPEGIDSIKVLSFLIQKYKIEIGGGLGPTFGQIFRIGLMGGSATQEMADKVVKVLAEAVEATRNQNVISNI